MSKILRVVLVVAMVGGLVFVFSSPGGAAPPERHPAVGAWTAIDSVDGSNLSLTLRGGVDGRVRLRLFDDEATLACPVFDSPALAFGRGQFVDNDLDLTVRVICRGEANLGLVALGFTYDPIADEITSGGDTYTRV